jgi:WD40 repeat protein
VREKIGTTTRKLIGHSGPVYSVSFDPLGGSAAPPRYLLSSSADSTARLWSMDTLTNVVAYRGHQGPVWDAQWSPMGIYFATGSRDRTARLWSTERVSALRVYAGHLSDVDVSCISTFAISSVDMTENSVFAFIQIPYTWRQARATGRVGCGMFRRVHVYASL